MDAPLSITKKPTLVNISEKLLSIKTQLMTDNPKLSEFESTSTLLSLIIENYIGSYYNTPGTLLNDDIQTPIINVLSAQRMVKEIFAFDSCLDLLPHSIEILSYSLKQIEQSSRDRRNGIKNNLKKTNGIYYTPDDVVVYITKQCISRMRNSGTLSEKSTFVDCSCGSGLFLSQILNELVQSYGYSPDHVVKNMIYGVDISKTAKLFTLFTVALNYSRIIKTTPEELHVVISCLSKHIVVGDGTLTTTFDNLPLFSCVIGNPPYGTNNSFQYSNQFIPFVYNMINCSDETGVSSLIVPLSITYSTKNDFKKLRQFMLDQRGTWYFDNYDRSPDALFGDDVKTRNTIISINKNEKSGIHTTGLQRWTSKNRSIILDVNKSFIDTDLKLVDGVFPKIGQKFQDKFLSKLLNIYDNKPTMISKNKTENSIFIKNTTYNWISAYDEPPLMTDKKGSKQIASGFNEIFCTSYEAKLLYLALLNSTWGYLLWALLGDGFHFTSKYITLLEPILSKTSSKDKDQLIATIKNVMKSCKERVRIKHNAGLAVENYFVDPNSSEISAIDELIAKSLGMSDDDIIKLHLWYNDHIS